MTDDFGKRGFVYKFWSTCKKCNMKVNGTKQTKINVVFET